MRRALLLALALAGCSFDTELGLAVDVTSASGEVAMDAGGDVVSVTMTVDYRTGAHAMEAHTLRPQSVDLFAGDAPVATLTPNRPPGFVPTVRPGQSFTTTMSAQSAPGSATDPRRLCGTEAHLVFRWVDDATGDVGTSEATTSPIDCD